MEIGPDDEAAAEASPQNETRHALSYAHEGLTLRVLGLTRTGSRVAAVPWAGDWLAVSGCTTHCDRPSHCFPVKAFFASVGSWLAHVRFRQNPRQGELGNCRIGSAQV